MPGVDAGTISSEVRIALDKLKGDVKKVITNFDKLASGSKAPSKKVESNWNKTFKSIKLGGVAAIAAITIAFKAAVSTFAKTEQSLANVQAVTNATADEFEQLKNAAEEAGRTTRFAASEAADAMFFLASAGFDATQTVESLNGVLLLAGATGSDLAQSAQAVTATLSQYKLEAIDAEKVVNIFAAANSNSQATLEKLQGALKSVGPIAGNFGITLEETTASLQALFNAGLSGEESGTALRNILLTLSDASSSVVQEFVATGGAINDVNPRIVGITTAFENLQKAGIDFAEVFDKRAVSSALILGEAAASTKDNLRDLEAAVTGTNEAARQYAVQNDTLAGSFDKFTSALEGTSNSIIETLAPAFRVILDSLASVLNFVTGLPAPLKGLGAGFGTAALAAGVLGKSLSLLGVSAAGALGPIGLIVGVISGVAIALNEATREQREYNEHLETLDRSLGSLNNEFFFMIEELEDLRAKTILTADEQERQNEIIEDLKAAYPGLTDEIINNTTALKQNEIQQQELKKAAAEADLKVLTDDYKELNKELDAQSEKIRKDIIDQWQRVNPLMARTAEAARENAEARKEYTKSIEDLTSYEQFREEMSRQGGSLQNTALGYINTAEHAAELGIEISNAENIIAEFSKSIDENKASIQDEIDQIEAQRKAQENARIEREKNLQLLAEEEKKKKEAAIEEESRLNEVEELNKKNLDKLREATLDRLELLEFERQEAIKEAEAIGADTIRIHEFYDVEAIKLEDERVAAEEDLREKAAEDAIKLEEDKQEELAKLAEEEFKNKELLISLIQDEEERAKTFFLVDLKKRVDALRDAGVTELQLAQFILDEKKKFLDSRVEAVKDTTDEEFKLYKENLERIAARETSIEELQRTKRIKAAEERIALSIKLREEAEKIAEEVNKINEDLDESSKKKLQDIINATLKLTTILFNAAATAEELADSFAKFAAEALMQSGVAALQVAGLIIEVGRQIANFIVGVIEETERLDQEIIDINRNTQQQILDNTKDRVDEEFRLEKDSIDRIEKERLDAFLRTLSKKEVEALKVAGIIEETELERINRELQEAVKANDEEAQSLLTNELQIASIRDLATQERLAAEQAYNEEVRKIERANAVINKEIQLAGAEISKQSALAELPWYTSQANINKVAARYDELINAISSISIPSLQTGGIVLPQKGGVATIQAENGFPELDINAGPSGQPLLDEFASRIAEQIALQNQGMNVTVIIDGVVAQTVSEINNGNVEVKL